MAINKKEANNPPQNITPSHAWSSATADKSSSLTQITGEGSYTPSSSSTSGRARGNDGSAGGDQILGVDEAERLIESLEERMKDESTWGVEQIGGMEFLVKHADIERLNLQAHANAQTKTDEFILEYLLTFSLFPLLIRDLITIETWRVNVLPLLLENVAENNNVMRVYFTLYHEATLVNLLEVLVFHKHVVEALGESSIELVDYCARRMANLSVPIKHNEMVRTNKRVLTAAEASLNIETRDHVKEINDHALEIEFKVSIASVALARYLCEHFDALPLSAQTRILDTHDFMVMLVPLIDEPPWTRRNDTQWEKWSDTGKWEKVDRGDLLKLTKVEAQVWLSIYFLTSIKACRSQYGLNAFRKDQLLRLRKYLNDVILDQLPILADVMRYMDELALMSVPENSNGQGSALMMQQVASVREKIMRGKVWKDVASAQFETIWSRVTDKTDKDIRIISEIYSHSNIEDIFGEAKPFELTSQPIGSVLLEIFHSGGVVRKVEFGIKKGDEGAVTDTADGDYRRFKLVEKKGGKEGKEEEDSIVPSDANVTATVTFSGAIPHVCILRLPNLELTTGRKEDCKSAKVWKQVGSLADKLVLQLGFERFSEDQVVFGYKVGKQLFLSQPIWEPIGVE